MSKKDRFSVPPGGIKQVKIGTSEYHMYGRSFILYFATGSKDREQVQRMVNDLREKYKEIIATKIQSPRQHEREPLQFQVYGVPDPDTILSISIIINQDLVAQKPRLVMGIGCDLSELLLKYTMSYNRE